MSSDAPRVGVLGAGQLALMLAEAGQRIGVEVVCAGQPGDCAGRVAKLEIVDLADPAAVAAFAATVDILTPESENIDVAVLDTLDVAPNARAIEVAQDRLLEKQFLERCGFAVAPYAAVDDEAGLAAAVAAIGTPAILKTRRFGYDGKGQARLAGTGDAAAAWAALFGSSGGDAPAILEGLVAFEREVSLLAARGAGGQTEFYPLTENVHRDGILRRSAAPFDDPALQMEAEELMQVVLNQLDYVGVLAIEFFVAPDGNGGKLIANEMAPRVHNSGHWTIEGAKTSQFDNHLRAIAGLTLGATDSQPTVMLNCIGAMPPAAETAGLWVHDYGKTPRPGRKVGHLTFRADDPALAAWEAKLGA